MCIRDRPEPEFVRRVEELVLSHGQVLGLHDLVIHDYGPGRRMISLHVEVSAAEDILVTHDMIDNIEKQLSRELGCAAIIHMDPILVGDARIDELRLRTAGLVRGIDPRLTIHDFRVVTGPVSYTHLERYNGAVAHSVCYGLSVIPEVEKNFLHGDIVAYGILVQLMLDKDREQASVLRDFLKGMGTPVTLADFGLPNDDALLAPVIEKALSSSDMEYLPYPVTGDMLRAAITAVEEL